MTGRFEIVSLLTNLTLAHSPAHRVKVLIAKELGRSVRIVKLFS